MIYGSSRPTRDSLTPHQQDYVSTGQMNATIEAWMSENGSTGLMNHVFSYFEQTGMVLMWGKSSESTFWSDQQGTVSGGKSSVMVWGVLNWHTMETLIHL